MSGGGRERGAGLVEGVRCWRRKEGYCGGGFASFALLALDFPRGEGTWLASEMWCFIDRKGNNLLVILQSIFQGASSREFDGVVPSGIVKFCIEAEAPINNPLPSLDMKP